MFKKLLGLFKKKEMVSDDEKYVKRLEVKDGKGLFTHIEGAKYPMRGMPREPVLKKVLDPFKAKMEKYLIEKIWEFIPHEVPESKMSEPVKEIARVFDLLIEAEEMVGMKAKWKAWKKAICLFLQEDLSYRYRFQWLAEKLNKKKIKLKEEDKYYFRAKYFKVD